MPDGSLYVLSGPNGAGKSSVLGAALAAAGRPFYNPDVAARELRTAHPRMSQPAANRDRKSVV